MTKAMATSQMWTQAQPAERACRGAAAAERRLNGVAYTAPPRVVSLRKLRDSYDTYRVDNDLDLAGALRAQICSEKNFLLASGGAAPAGAPVNPRTPPGWP